MNWARQINLKRPAELKTMRKAGRINATVLAAVKELAELRGRSAGEVLSALARTALAGARAGGGLRNGVPLLEATGGEGIVTPDVVDRLRDDG